MQTTGQKSSIRARSLWAVCCDGNPAVTFEERGQAETWLRSLVDDFPEIDYLTIDKLTITERVGQ